MSGLDSLPKAKWSETGRQVILKEDFFDIEDAIVNGHARRALPALTWVDATSVRVTATADSPASLMAIGFPNILHPGLFIHAGLTDNKYRENTSSVTMDFDVAESLWGLEKASQWYIIYAIAGDADATFTLKAMPFMRVKSQADQVISLGTLTTPATGIGYGFTTDELIDSKLYFLTGASAGLIRTISANNNNSTTGGTITYTGDALTMAEGNWFVVLPNTNFRWLKSIFNNASSNIVQARYYGKKVWWTNKFATTNTTAEVIIQCCPLATSIILESGDVPVGEHSISLIRGEGEVIFCATPNQFALVASPYVVGYSYSDGV